MNKVTKILISAMAFIVMQSSVQAATVEIKWTEPDEYRDIRPGTHDTKKSFRKSVFAEFNEHFTGLAEDIPQNYTLKINVTDIDLAGDINFGGMSQIRIVKDLYFPSMKFSFELVDENGVVAHSGEEKLKDMNFMMGNTLKYRNRFLSYEKRMLDDWFDETFESFIKK